MFASIYFHVSYFAGDSKSAEGQELIFFSCDCFPFLLVAFLLFRGSFASSSVHASSLQVALGLLFRGGFVCFGVLFLLGGAGPKCRRDLFAVISLLKAVKKTFRDHQAAKVLSCL